MNINFDLKLKSNHNRVPAFYMYYNSSILFKRPDMEMFNLFRDRDRERDRHRDKSTTVSRMKPS